LFGEVPLQFLFVDAGNMVLIMSFRHSCARSPSNCSAENSSVSISSFREESGSRFRLLDPASVVDSAEDGASDGSTVDGSMTVDAGNSKEQSSTVKL
jgi:hypothetical protein